MYCIALTGGIASGKSTVADLFSHYGIPILSADSIAKQVSNKGGPCFNAIVDYFGVQFLDSKTGDLNRKMLRKIIFKDSKKRLWLEKLTHPIIQDKIKKAISNAQGPYCLIEIPLLVKHCQYHYISRILLVTTTKSIQISRIQSRDKTSVADAIAIMKAQPDEKQRIENADDIIHNDNNMESLQKSVYNLHKKYLSLSSP